MLEIKIIKKDKMTNKLKDLLKEEDEHFLILVCGRILGMNAIYPIKNLNELLDLIRNDWKESQEKKNKLAIQELDNQKKDILEKIDEIFSEGWFLYMWTTYRLENRQIGEDMIKDIDKKVKELKKQLGEEQ